MLKRHDRDVFSPISNSPDTRFNREYDISGRQRWSWARGSRGIAPVANCTNKTLHVCLPLRLIG